MKKFKNTKKISIALSSIIFLTTLAVFVSFILEPKNSISSDVDKIEIINLNLKKEVLQTKKINSIVDFKNVNGNYKKYFAKPLIKTNLYSIIEESIKISKEINYDPKSLNYEIFFKILSDNEISIKLELIPKNNYKIKFNSKFKLIIN